MSTSVFTARIRNNFVVSTAVFQISSVILVHLSLLSIAHNTPHPAQRPQWNQSNLCYVTAAQLSVIVTPVQAESGALGKGDPKEMPTHEPAIATGRGTCHKHRLCGTVLEHQQPPKRRSLWFQSLGALRFVSTDLGPSGLDWIKPKRNLFIPSALNTNQKHCSSLEGAEMQSKLLVPFLSLGGIWKCKALNTNCLNWTYVNLF